MNTSRVYIVAVAWFLAIGLGCNKRNENATLYDQSNTPRYGGAYRINMVRGNPNGLDPVIITSKLADDISLQIYDRLFTLDSALGLKPELALRYDINNNGKRYTFHLRTDVLFHDNACFPQGKGRLMTAHDVVYSLTRCCDPQARTAAYWVFKNKVVGADAYYQARAKQRNSPTKVEGMYAVDDSTVRVELTRAYSPFLYQLINALGCIVPHEAVELYGKDFFRHPVGTGAFTFVAWNDDYNMILAKNNNYWDKDAAGRRLPYLDTVEFRFIKDDKIQYEEFRKGNLEESFTIPTELYDVLMNSQTKTPRKDLPFIVQQKPAMLTWFMDFLCTQEPFNDVHLRRAFSYAIDRERIVRYVLRNAPYAPAMHGITPPVMPGYTIDSIKGWSYDPQKAQQEFSKSAFAKNKKLPPITLHIYAEPRLVQVAEAVQQMIAENLNINISIQILQFAQLLDMAEAGKLQFWGTRWYGDYPDVENYLSLLDGSLVPTVPNQPSYPNSTRWNNHSFNQIMAEAVAQTNDSTRLAMYKKAENIAMEESPAIMLFYEMHYRLLQPYVRNYPLDAMNRIVLKNVWFAKSL